MEGMASESRAAHIASLKARIVNAQTVEEINYLWSEVEALKASSTCCTLPVANTYVQPVAPAPSLAAPIFHSRAPPPAPTTIAEHAMKNPCEFSNLSRSTSSGSLSTAAGNSIRGLNEVYDSPPSSPGSQQECLDLGNVSATSSAQSSAGASDADDDDWQVASADRLEFSVRNTFIDFKRERAPSLDDFFIERHIQSCPASRKCSMDDAENDVNAVDDADITHAKANETELPVLRLAEVLAPKAEAVELPSVGSQLHGSGTCRPCVFFPSKGCSSGPACAFCHLCTPLSRKEKKAILKRKRTIGDRQVMLACESGR